MGDKVGENPAALRAAVFLLSAKNRRGGCSNTPPPSRAKVNTIVWQKRQSDMASTQVSGQTCSGSISRIAMQAKHAGRIRLIFNQSDNRRTVFHIDERF